MRPLRTALLAALTCAVACGSPDDSGLCADEPPVVTWDNFGAGFVVENCQSCHASTSVDRRDAPEHVVFDTREDTLDQRERILARATGEDHDMPPEGGVPEDERYLLEVWLTCWE